MRAVVIHAEKDLRVEQQQAERPGPGQVLIQVERGGICGSDLHYFNHGGFGTVRLREPMILGHEVAGRIIELGTSVAGLATGDLVAVSPSRPCGHCRYCLEGKTNHCLNMRFYGSAMPFPHIQGAFREQLVADASQCVIANGLSAGEAACAEPLSVCLHATRQAGEMLGKRVLVTGSGPIGVLTIAAARRAGAAEIVATDMADFPLEHAKTAGADLTIAPSPGSSTTATVAAGKPATYGLQLTPVAGASGTYTLSCTGAPTGATCTPSVASINLSGTTPVPVTVTVTTTARTSGAPPLGDPAPGQPWQMFLLLAGLGLLALALAIVWRGPRRAARWLTENRSAGNKHGAAP